MAEFAFLASAAPAPRVTMSHSPTSHPSTTALVLAFSTIYLAWGSTYLAMKVAVETLPPFAMASARFMVAGLILHAINRARGLPRATARQWRDNTVVGVLLLFGGSGLVGWAGQFLPSGVTALLVGMVPFWMVLAEWIWPGGRRPGAWLLGGLALGFAGAAWLAAPWEHGMAGGLPPGGVLAILGACALWALGSIWSRRAGNPAHLLVAASAQMIAGGVALGIAAIAGGELSALDRIMLDRDSLLAWGYLLVVGLVGLPVYGWLLQHSTPARVSTHAYVNPVVAVFLGWLVLDEPVSPRMIVSAAVIVVSVIVITWSREGEARVAQSRSPRATLTVAPLQPSPRARLALPESRQAA